MNVKLIIGVGISFIGGIATGAFGASLYFKKQTETYVEEVREMYKKHMEDVSDDILSNVVNKFNEVDAAREKSKINQNKPEIGDYKRTVDKLNYSAFSAVNGAKNGLKTGNLGPSAGADKLNGDNSEGSDNDSENSDSNDGKIKDPRPELTAEEVDVEGPDDYVVHDELVRDSSLTILNDGSYFSKSDEYEKIVCTYYAENEITIGDEDDMIIDTSRWPYEWVEEFRDGVLWIRDNRINTDYEITYDEGSYYGEDIY